MTAKNLTITRSIVNTEHVYLPDPTNPLIGLDLTGYTLKAEARDKPAGTLLCTFTCAANSPPDVNMLPNGWVKLSLDNSVVIGAGYRGTWSLLGSIGASDPVLLAAGQIEIFSQATTW